MSKNIENAIQAIYKNGKWYVGGGTGGTSIIYADSVDALPDPATVPEGTIALVPVNDEVVDLTGVFDYATSIMQGGALCRVSHDCTELLNRLKKGAVRIKGGLDGYFSTNTVLAQIIDDFSGGYAQYVVFAEFDGALLYLFTMIDNEGISFSCKQVTTTPYVPS